MFIVEPQFCEQQQKLLLVNSVCLCGSDWLALLRSFWHITTLHLYKPGLSKLYAWVNGFILQNTVSVWSF